uniref:PCNA-associated factor n=1 Tax=Serinus canaria TaxID=9135 RepID=A0A8C9NQR6_SERCA
VPIAAAERRCPLVSAVLVARAPRKALGSGSGSGGVSDRRPVGLNRVCVRPVPAWQRGISDFLQLPSKESRASDGDTPGTSGGAHKNQPQIVLQDKQTKAFKCIPPVGKTENVCCSTGKLSSL